MAIHVYRVLIEGFVVDHDFGGRGPKVTPGDWPLDALVEAMGANVQITETLIATIEDTPIEIGEE